MTDAERAALDGRLEECTRQLVECAAAQGATVCTAESCTAGLVASTIAGVPGASAVLVGGAVTYCDRVKHEVLGVSSGTLAAFSAVSAQTACEMSQGARRLFSATCSVSLTGYAGPGGGTDADPAGTVYISTSADSGTVVRRFTFEGERNEVRAKAARKALEMLLEILTSM